MTYQIELSEAAESEAEKTYLYFSSRSPEFAGRWFRNLLTAISRLEFMPYRYPASQNDGIGLRQMLVGSGRSAAHVLYLVIEPDGKEAKGLNGCCTCTRQ
jgi:plasmid stabilization system protein ParE